MTANLFFQDFDKHQGTWRPPVYPTIDDVATWNTAFVQANDLTKRDLAHLWCWRFEQEFQEQNPGLIVKMIPQHHQWLTRIRPYVDLPTLNDAFAFNVYPNYIKRYGKIPNGFVEDYVKHVDSVMYGSKEECESAMYELGVLFKTYSRLHIEVSMRVLNTLESIMWDKVRSHGIVDDMALSGAIRTSVFIGLHHLSTSSVDNDMATPWRTLALACSKMRPLDKDAYETLVEQIRHTPPLVAVPALSLICQHLAQQGFYKDDHFELNTPLDPTDTKLYNIWEIFSHWIPSQATLWSTAEATGMSMNDAILHVRDITKQSTSSNVTLPSNLSGFI